MSQRKFVGAALAFGVALLVACGSNNGGAAKTLTLGSTTFNNHGTKAAGNAASVAIEADDFYFEPTFVSGAPGQTLTLNLTNDSATEHNFSVTAQGVDTDIPAKGKATVTITLPASGVLQFFCKYHTGSGMNGELLAGNAQPQAPSGAAPAATQKAKSSGYDYGY